MQTSSMSYQCGSTGSHARMAFPASPCPRCQSSNTKFCYFNNYNFKQPRFFCKSCQRYWTAGGSLRNVPVGSGRRKNKRVAVNKPRPALLPEVINEKVSISVMNVSPRSTVLLPEVVDEKLFISGMNVSPRSTVLPSNDSESVSCELRLALPRETAKADETPCSSPGLPLPQIDDNLSARRASSLPFCFTARSVQDHFHGLFKPSSCLTQPDHAKYEENPVDFGTRSVSALAQPYHVKEEENVASLAQPYHVKDGESVASFGAKPCLEVSSEPLVHVASVRKQDVVTDRSCDLEEKHQTQNLKTFLNVHDGSKCPVATVKMGAFDGLLQGRLNIINGKTPVWRHVSSHEDVENDVIPSSDSMSSSTASSEMHMGKDHAGETLSWKCSKNKQNFKIATTGGMPPTGTCVPSVLSPNYIMWYPYMWWSMQMPVSYANCANSKILGKHYRSTSSVQEESVCAPKSLKFGHPEDAQYASTLATLGLGNQSKLIR